MSKKVFNSVLATIVAIATMKMANLSVFETLVILALFNISYNVHDINCK